MSSSNRSSILDAWTEDIKHKFKKHRFSLLTLKRLGVNLKLKTIFKKSSLIRVKILVKPRDFEVKHYINIHRRIVIDFLWDSRYLRLFLYFRIEVTSDKSNVLQNRWSQKFCNIQKKTPVLESLFNKVALKLFIKKRVQHSYFPVNIAKFLRTAFAIEHGWRRLLTWP